MSSTVASAVVRAGAKWRVVTSVHKCVRQTGVHVRLSTHDEDMHVRIQVDQGAQVFVRT